MTAIPEDEREDDGEYFEDYDNVSSRSSEEDGRGGH
jgi:hypothetical protein